MNVTWTVVGIWDDSGQSFADHVYDVADCYEAMAVVARRHSASESLCIIGAIPGEAQLTTPGDDNGQAAYASDLADLTA